MGATIVVLRALANCIVEGSGGVFPQNVMFLRPSDSCLIVSVIGQCT